MRALVGDRGFLVALIAQLLTMLIETNGPGRSMPERGTVPRSYDVFRRGLWTTTTGHVIEEAYVSIFVNGQELVTIMATPRQQEYLAVGYLLTEGIITHRDDLLDVSVAPNQTCVDVWLKKELALPQRRILTSGCGKGTTFDTLSPHLPPLVSNLRMTHGQLVDRLGELQEQAQLYRRARGVHAAGLATQSALTMWTEDAGRHNTLDKLAGRCLLEEIDPSGHVLLTSGRISSDMISKVRRMNIPLVASRTSPTSLSVLWAERWNITVVGYLRPDRMHVYTHPERLK